MRVRLSTAVALLALLAVQTRAQFRLRDEATSAESDGERRLLENLEGALDSGGNLDLGALMDEARERGGVVGGMVTGVGEFNGGVRPADGLLQEGSDFLRDTFVNIASPEECAADDELCSCDNPLLHAASSSDGLLGDAQKCDLPIKVGDCPIPERAQTQITTLMRETDRPFSLLVESILETLGVENTIPQKSMACMDCSEDLCRSCFKRKKLLAGLLQCNGDGNIGIKPQAGWSYCLARKSRRCPAMGGKTGMCNDPSRCADTDFCGQLDAIKEACVDRSELDLENKLDCVPMACGGECKSMYTYAGMPLNVTEMDGCPIPQLASKEGIEMDAVVAGLYCRATMKLAKDREQGMMIEGEREVASCGKVDNAFIPFKGGDDMMTRDDVTAMMEDGSLNPDSVMQEPPPPSPRSRRETPTEVQVKMITCSQSSGFDPQTGPTGVEPVHVVNGVCLFEFNPDFTPSGQAPALLAVNGSVEHPSCKEFCKAHPPNGSPPPAFACCDRDTTDGKPCNHPTRPIARVKQTLACGKRCNDKERDVLDSMCAKCEDDADCDYNFNCVATQCVPPVKGRTGEDALKIHFPVSVMMEKSKGFLNKLDLCSVFSQAINNDKETCSDKQSGIRDSVTQNCGAVAPEASEALGACDADGKCGPAQICYQGLCYACDFATEAQYEDAAKCPVAQISQLVSIAVAKAASDANAGEDAPADTCANNPLKAALAGETCTPTDRPELFSGASCEDMCDRMNNDGPRALIEEALDADTASVKGENLRELGAITKQCVEDTCEEDIVTMTTLLLADEATRRGLVDAPTCKKAIRALSCSGADVTAENSGMIEGMCIDYMTVLDLLKVIMRDPDTPFDQRKCGIIEDQLGRMSRGCRQLRDREVMLRLLTRYGTECADSGLRNDSPDQICTFIHIFHCMETPDDAIQRALAPLSSKIFNAQVAEQLCKPGECSEDEAACDGEPEEEQRICRAEAAACGRDKAQAVRSNLALCSRVRPQIIRAICNSNSSFDMNNLRCLGPEDVAAAAADHNCDLSAKLADVLSCDENKRISGLLPGPPLRLKEIDAFRCSAESCVNICEAEVRDYPECYPYLKNCESATEQQLTDMRRDAARDPEMQGLMALASAGQGEFSLDGKQKLQPNEDIKRLKETLLELVSGGMGNVTVNEALAAMMTGNELRKLPPSKENAVATCSAVDTYQSATNQQHVARRNCQMMAQRALEEAERSGDSAARKEVVKDMIRNTNVPIPPQDAKRLDAADLDCSFDASCVLSCALPLDNLLTQPAPVRSKFLAMIREAAGEDCTAAMLCGEDQLAALGQAALALDGMIEDASTLGSEDALRLAAVLCEMSGASSELRSLSRKLFERQDVMNSDLMTDCAGAVKFVIKPSDSDVPDPTVLEAALGSEGTELEYRRPGSEADKLMFFLLEKLYESKQEDPEEREPLSAEDFVSICETHPEACCFMHGAAFPEDLDALQDIAPYIRNCYFNDKQWQLIRPKLEAAIKNNVDSICEVDVDLIDSFSPLIWRLTSAAELAAAACDEEMLKAFAQYSDRSEEERTLARFALGKAADNNRGVFDQVASVEVDIRARLVKKAEEDGDISEEELGEIEGAALAFDDVGEDALSADTFRAALENFGTFNDELLDSPLNAKAADAASAVCQRAEEVYASEMASVTGQMASMVGRCPPAIFDTLDEMPTSNTNLGDQVSDQNKAAFLERMMAGQTGSSRARRSTDDCSGMTSTDILALGSLICDLSTACISSLSESNFFDSLVDDDSAMNEAMCTGTVSEALLEKMQENDVLGPLTGWTGNDLRAAGYSAAYLTGAELATLPSASAIAEMRPEVFEELPWAEVQALVSAVPEAVDHLTDAQVRTLTEAQAASIGITDYPQMTSESFEEANASGRVAASMMIAICALALRLLA